MLTIFTIPKPFAGHSGLIQRNAIASWRRLTPLPEIILCGQDAGVAETAAEFGVRHLPDIPCNAYGTPLLSAAFARVQALAAHPLICYANADIIFLTDLPAALSSIPFARFLLAGQRWDLDVTEPLDLAAGDPESRLRQEVAVRGRRHPPSGSDYFVFPRGSIRDLPEFAVGRIGWDNWLLYYARSLGMPVIDGSEAVTVIHQNHDYAHVARRRNADSSDNPEGDRNLALMGGRAHVFLLADATHRLTATGPVAALEDRYLMQRLGHLYVLAPGRDLVTRLRRRALNWVGRHHRLLPDGVWRRLVYAGLADRVKMEQRR
ncbi:MAG TPA: hypothetical protein VGA61_08860 [Anaerolineae bacterium]